jgi:hypothetical protein
MQLGHTEKFVAAKHSIKVWKRIDFNSIFKLWKVIGHMDHIVKEATQVISTDTKVSPWNRHGFLWQTCLCSPVKHKWKSNCLTLLTSSKWIAPSHEHWFEASIYKHSQGIQQHRSRMLGMQKVPETSVSSDH